MKCPVLSFEVSMGLVLLWPPAFLCSGLFMFLLCWRISLVCLALKLVGSWVEVGFIVSMEVLGELLSINSPWSQESSGVLRI